MVSFQTLSPNPPSPLHHPNTITQLDNKPSKKRKLDDREEPCYLDPDSKVNLWMNTSFSPQKSSAMDFHPEIPSASYWQRSLNTQPEYFFNTGTYKRSEWDPRARETTPHPATLAHTSLDLELNLTCGDHRKISATKMNRKSNSSANNKIPSTLSLFSSSSSSPSPAADDRDQQEMVAAACKRCHLLVMLCKSYPACPNCKFMHPTQQNPPNLLKPRLGLLC